MRQEDSVRRWWRLSWRVAAAVVLAWLLVTVGAVLLLRFVPPPASAFMVIHKLGALADGRNVPIHYRWVPWDQISLQVPLAMVAAEDQRFPLHHGFDLKEIRAALEQSRDGAGLRGASTISQQTAKNLFLWSGRSWLRKGLEAYFTVLIEALWPKQRILEVYVNIAELGEGVYGVGAASEVFFGRSAAHLNTHQASLLAAALPNPKDRQVDHPSPLMQERAAWIRRQMRQLGGVDYVDPDAAEAQQ